MKFRKEEEGVLPDSPTSPSSGIMAVSPVAFLKPHAHIAEAVRHNRTPERSG